MCQNKLLFDLILKEDIGDTPKPANARHAVRGIAVKDDKVLMIMSSRGDCKLPGGGIDGNESHEQALIREIAEEAGRCCLSVSSMIGRVYEEKIDVFDNSMIFRHTSHYYAVRVDDTPLAQKLDDYEIELGFTPKWLTIDEALQINNKYISNAKVIDWTKRENKVLRLIQEIGLTTVDKSIQQSK